MPDTTDTTDTTDTAGRRRPAGRLVTTASVRFGSAVTSAVLATALLLRDRTGAALVAWQWAVFAIAATKGMRYSIYGRTYLTLSHTIGHRFPRRIPAKLEPAGGPRFAQLCGLIVLTVALAALAAGAPTIAWAAVGTVLTLSLLLATTNICLACRLYGLSSRLHPRTGTERPERS
jgi:hypothetical protein